MNDNQKARKWKFMIGVIAALAIIGILDFKGIFIILAFILVVLVIWFAVPLIHLFRMGQLGSRQPEQKEKPKNERSAYQGPDVWMEEQAGPVIDLVEDENGRLVKASEKDE